MKTHKGYRLSGGPGHWVWQVVPPPPPAAAAAVAAVVAGPPSGPAG
jgi:hypothetical protein